MNNKGISSFLLRDLQYRDPGRSAAPLLQEDRLDYGLLICFDQDTGRRLWSQRSQPAVVSPVYGDPGSPIVLWATEDSERLFNQQLRGGIFQQDEAMRGVSGGPTIHLQLLDRETGQVIAERHDLNPSAILRCVYHADKNELHLETQNSTITVEFTTVEESVVF